MSFQASRRGRSCRYTGVLLLGWLLGADPSGAADPGLQHPAPAATAVRYLSSAERLIRLGLTEFAAEHLLEIDSTSLANEYIPSYAALIALSVEKLSFVSPSLETLVRENLEAERLRPLADTWNASAVVSIKRGRVSDALEAWDGSLRREPVRARRVANFRRAIEGVTKLAQTDRERLQYDPQLQAGALRSFVATWAQNTDLGSEPEIAGALLVMEQRLDPEGPEAEFWADRFLTLTEASPHALYRRGALEAKRGRPTSALPWLLWAAYTDGVESALAPRSWGALALVYRAMNWCDHAAEAFRLSGNSGQPPACSEEPERAQATAECLYWHDELLGSSPERMVIRWRGDWQSSFPDLAIWKSKCSSVDWGRREGHLDHCPSYLRLPRLAARQLRSWKPEELLCALSQTTIQSKGLVGRFRAAQQQAESFQQSTPEGSKYWEARALFALRQGDLAEAMPHFKRSLEHRLPAHLAQVQVVRHLSALAASPVPDETRFAAFLLERLETMKTADDRLPGLHGRSRALAAGWRHADPESPSAVRWSEQALIDALDVSDPAIAESRAAGRHALWTPLEPAYAWLGRARLELDRGRLAAALPYLLWAHQELGAEEIDRPLVGVLTRLRWWDLALEVASADAPELPELSSLNPEDLLPSKLPDRCRSLYTTLEQADASGAVRAARERWRERVRGLGEWLTLCAATRLEPKL